MIVLVCPREGLESLAVDLVSTGIVRRQRHVALALDGIEGEVDTSTEPLHILGGEGAVAQVVQEVDEAGILLAVDVSELDIERGILLQDVCVEEEEAGVVLAQYVPLLWLDHGWELHQVADEEHLHTAEG